MAISRSVPSTHWMEVLWAVLTPKQQRSLRDSAEIVYGTNIQTQSVEVGSMLSNDARRSFQVLAGKDKSLLSE